MAHTQWSSLRRTQPDNGPEILLFRFPHSNAGYKLLVTDLIEVWECSRSRDDILSQAAVDKSSIDPSEDASHFDVLLQNLADCLSGHNGGKCTLHKHDTQSGSFELRTSIALPAPLGSLTWTFLLQLKNQRTTGAFSQELLLPALAEEARGQQQVQSLKQIIQQKDHVIRRLLDKIEGSSIDLSAIFPGIGGGKHRQKRLDTAQVASSVPGLAAFDETAWSHDQEAGMPASGPTSVGIMGAVGNEEIQSMMLNGVTQRNKDWTPSIVSNSKGRSAASQELQSLRDRMKHQHSRDNESTRNSPNDRDGAPTTPKRRDHHGSRNNTIFVDRARSRPDKRVNIYRSKKSSSSTSSSTDTESDDSKTERTHEDVANSLSDESLDVTATLDLSSRNGDRIQRNVSIEHSRSSPPDSDDHRVTAKHHDRPNPRLGRIGRRRKSDDESPAPRSKSPQASTVFKEGSSSSQQLAYTGNPSSAAPRQSPPSTPSRRLGKISAGNRGTTNPVSRASPFDISKEREPSSSNHDKTWEPLKNAEAIPSSPSTNSKSRVPQSLPHEKPKLRPETVEEKTARKRMEIKQIEEGPVKKKKRKF